MRTIITYRFAFISNHKPNLIGFFCAALLLIIATGCTGKDYPKVQINENVSDSNRSSQTSDVFTSRQNMDKMFALQDQSSNVRVISSSTVASKTDDYPTSMRIIGVGNLSRASDQYDDRGRMHPPWTQSVFSFSPLHKPIESGDSVTVVPLLEGLPASIAPVHGARETSFCSKTRWEIDRVKVNEEDYNRYKPSSASGFETAVIHPPVSNFNVYKESYSAIPNGFSRKTTQILIDVSGDENPDLALFKYCCGKPSVNPDSTDDDCYRCGAGFHRNASGTWVQTFLSHPC